MAEAKMVAGPSLPIKRKSKNKERNKLPLLQRNLKMLGRMLPIVVAIWENLFYMQSPPQERTSSHPRKWKYQRQQKNH